MEDVTVVYKHLWKTYVYATHPTVVAFIGRDIISFVGIFGIFSPAERIKFTVYIKIFQ